MSDDHLHEVLVPFVLTQVLQLLLGLVRDVSGPLGQFVRLVLRVLELGREDLLDLFLGFGRSELVLERRSDLVRLVTLRHLLAHLYI